MREKINQAEVELLSNALERILNTEVLTKHLSGVLPKTEDLKDSNTVYGSKVSILFVDMRNSTQLPDCFDSETLVKIYRSYIRSIVQAIRYSDGVVRDFMGDGVLAVFVDDENGTSEEKSVYAARYITTVIDKFLNPLLNEKFHYRISCGIGIHTGNIYLSKVGMKGKEQDEEAENEYGIAWIGNSTNLACKQSGVVGGGTIFISKSTYSALSNVNKDKIWKYIDVEKGKNVLSGYISQHYYLSLDLEVQPCCADFQDKILTFSELLQNKTDELIEKASTLGIKEKELNGKEIVLNKKEELLNNKEQHLNQTEYYLYKDVLRSGHCEKEYVIAMGVDFWEEHLKNVIVAGQKRGMLESVVKQDVSYIMVDIYQSLGLYDKAYEFLVEQANGGDWLILSVVQNIVRKVGYSYALKRALISRIEKGNLLPVDQKDFEEIRDWIVDDFENGIAPICRK